MSTVLWSNSLEAGEVTSDQIDLYALSRYLDKLDALCRQLGLSALSSFCDDTDMLVNLGRLELPAGMVDTNQLMASRGVWIEAPAASETLGKLLAHIQANGTRFGVLKNHHQQVVEELATAIKFAGSAAERGAKFNFAMVM